MKKQKLQSNLDFYLMSVEFCIRDWLRPPSKILQNVGVRSGMTVFDFGCGPGGFSIAAAKIVGPKGRVYAVDIHPLALRSVRSAAKKRGLDNIRPVFGDNLAEIGEGNVDIVLLYDVLHDLPEPGHILTELHRLLKPAGLLSVSDHHLKEAALLSMIIGDGLYRFVGRGQFAFQFAKAEASESAS